MKLVAANCPNCGAKIEVDQNSDRTICEYCNSQILVQDAIEKYKLEVSGEVEISNLPKLNDYLKLGERYYKNSEYKEAYEKYSKAIELDPDNYIAVLRRGLCKSLITNYMNFEIDSATNGMKNAYDIIQKLDGSKENKIIKVNESVRECVDVINRLKDFVIEFGKKNKFDLEGVSNYINNLKSCLSSLEYLYHITLNDDKLNILILNSTIDTIDAILQNKKYRTGQYLQNGTPLMASYKINSSYKNELLEKKQKCITEIQMLDPESAEKTAKKVKVRARGNGREHKILCYVMVVFSVLFLMTSLGYGLLLSALIWLISMLIFIPSVKRFILDKKQNYEKVIFWCRIIIPIVAMSALISGMPNTFDGTWIAENGMKVTLNSENATIITSDGEIKEGTYKYSLTNGEYKITVTCNNSEKYIFYYERENKEISFYLKTEVDGVEEITYFSPEDPDSYYVYVTE